MNAKKLVFISLFIALQIILTRFLAIQTPIVRISFTFLPIALSGIMFGPIYAGITAAIADLIGFMLFPSGPFFPGFTLSAFLTGTVFGMLLYKKPISFWRITIAVLIITIFIHLILDTVWLWMITGQGVLGLLPARIIKSAIMIPVQIVVIQLVVKYLSPKFLSKVSNE